MSPGCTHALIFHLLLAGSGAPATVESGLKALNDLDYTKAAKIFRAVIASHPSAGVAAEAHYRLGRMEIDQGNNADGARDQFEAALRADPTFEPPFDVSPDAHLIMDQARAQVLGKRRGGGAQALPPAGGRPASSASPPGAAPAEVVAGASESPSHVPAYVVGGLAVVSLAAGVILGVSANSALSDARATSSAATAQQQLATSGTEAIAADALFAFSGAAAVTAIILFFTERGSRPVEAGITPLPGGGAAFLGGTF